MELSERELISEQKPIIEGKSSDFFAKYRLKNIDLETAERYIKNAWIAGIISLVLTGLFAIFSEPYFWLDFVFAGVLIFGVYKKNVISAVTLLVYFVISKIYQFSTGEFNIFALIISIIFINYFFLGALGVIKYRKIKKHKGSTIKGILIGLAIGIGFTLLFAFFAFQGFLENWQNQAPSAEEVLYQADYSDGYKAGYADGRNYYGQISDSYSEPAAEERRPAYATGYLEGYIKGCKEGNFDCSEAESFLEQAKQELGGDNGTQYQIKQFMKTLV